MIKVSKWYNTLIKSIEDQVYWRADELPRFPSIDIQTRTVGQSGEATLKEAFIFYEDCKKVFGNQLTEDKSLLDFGVGWGRIARCFIEYIPKKNIYGIDVEQEFINITKSLFDNDNFYTCNPFPPTLFKDNSFDYIVAYSVFSHLSEEATEKWFKEFYRIIKPGGIIAVTTRGRWFLEYCKRLGKKEDATPYEKGLSKMFDDFQEALKRYDNGEFIHAFSPAISGAGAMNDSFYGETFIPPQYAENFLTDIYEHLAFLPEDHKNGRTHPIILYRSQKKQIESSLPYKLFDMLTDNYKKVCNTMAQRLNVSGEIHQNDFIFHFLFNNPSFVSKEKAIEYYFNDGFSSAQKLLSILKDICGFDSNKKLQLFEFASGYGCVTRHIKNVIPFAETTSCDIHQDAVQFIQDKLETKAVLSASHPEDFYLEQQFDVIFALSFFSHMPNKTFSQWLKKLTFLVKPGGYLIFTTHGLKSRKYFQSCHFDEEGFYFLPSSEQKDLDTLEYGSAVAKPQYVFARISETPKLTLKYFREGYWWEHQDTFVVKKECATTAEEKPNGPLLVYQMGKVGSRSVYKTLLDLDLGVKIYHAHVLDDLDNMEKAIKNEFQNPVNSLETIREGRELRRLIDSNPNQKWNLITLVRDPIARNVSRFFHSIEEVIPDIRQQLDSGSISIDKLLSVFLDKWEHKSARVWFDLQFKPVFNIDVYTRQFPIKKGYDIFRQGHFSVLLLKLENLDNCASRAFAEFLGISDLELMKENTSEEKWFNCIYRDFLSKVVLPDEYLNDMYKSQYAQHFYSPEEIQAFRVKWTQQPRKLVKDAP